MLKDNIEVTISDKKDSKVVVTGDYWRFLSPFNEDEKKGKEGLVNKFSVLPKDEVERLLATHQDQATIKREEITQMMFNLTEEVLQIKFLERELAIIKQIEATKNFFETQEDNFNKVKKETKDESIDVSITNGIYTLSIWARKSYRKNYDIRGYLTFNEGFNQKRTTIENFENQSYADISKVETYINNKLKKYNHLFTLKKVILEKDVQSYHIHPRIIKELGIEVFKSPADILKKADK